MKNLGRRAIVGLALLLATLAIALFVPAWTLNFWQAWVYLTVFIGSSALLTAYLWKNDRKLLEGRIRAGPAAEKGKSQKVVQGIAQIAFGSVLVLPALDHRFAWSSVPFPITIAGQLGLALGFLLVFFVFRENAFSIATIDVAADQSVVSTGPYALVRHPMYVGGLLIFLATPLALGSWWGLLVFIPTTFVILWRLLDEEAFLSKNLRGYSAYRQTVKYRLLPRIW